MDREEFISTKKGIMNMCGMVGLAIAWIWYPMLFPVVTGWYLFPTVQEPVCTKIKIPWMYMALVGLCLLLLGVGIPSIVFTLMSIGFFSWSLISDIADLSWMIKNDKSISDNYND